MLTRKRRRPTDEEIAEVEEALGRRLPPIYREFIIANNGGSPLRHLVESEDGVGAYFQYLFPMGGARGLAEEMHGPWRRDQVIAIGLLGDGGRLCLRLADDAIFLEEVGDGEDVPPLHPAGANIVEFFHRLHSGSDTQDSSESESDPDIVQDLADSGDVEWLEKFVADGANLQTAKTKYGESILEAAVMHEEIAFLEACLKLGAPIAKALHTAASANVRDTVEWLISKGADINELNEEGKTPLDMTGAFTGARLILENHGARSAEDL